MTNRRDGLERALNDAWYGSARWTYLFLPLLPFVAVFVGLKRIFRPRSKFAVLGAPIIVVGGLTAGGTGKTPTLIAIARYLSGRGFKVGVVSRGYGREQGQSALLIQSDHTAEKAGDEPLLIKRSVEKASVIVGNSRRDAATSLCREQGVSVILSDDGLQHYALPRDFEIAVLDAERGVGNGRLMPVGPLREPTSRLRSVDFVLERNGLDPMCSLTYRSRRLVNLNSFLYIEVEEALKKWRGKKVVAATGLGQPAQFFTTLHDLKIECETVSVADHSKLDLASIQREYEPDIIVVTAKDAVKIEREPCDNVWVLEIEAILPASLYSAIEQRLAQVAN
jgi:tetraacyldisaccharide 4'-kinase